MSEQTKACPACGKPILLAAIKCKHCKTRFAPYPGEATARTASVPVATRRRIKLPTLKRTTLIVGASVAGGCLVLGVLLAVYLNAGDDEVGESTPAPFSLLLGC